MGKRRGWFGGRLPFGVPVAAAGATQSYAAGLVERYVVLAVGSLPTASSSILDYLFMNEKNLFGVILMLPKRNARCEEIWGRDQTNGKQSEMQAKRLCGLLLLLLSLRKEAGKYRVIKSNVMLLLLLFLWWGGTRTFGSPIHTVRTMV